MRSTLNMTGPALIAVIALSACGSTKDAATGSTHVRDDVYYMPSSAPPPVAKAATPAQANNADDYYDPAQAGAYNDPRGFYDMAYNDPHYYNYGRFGFGMGVGVGLGSMGWYNPMGGLHYGWGMYHQPYWYDGYYGPWGRPWWMYNMGPGYYSMYDPYGVGPYYGPWGSCYGCYTPVMIGDWGGNTVTGHRPSLNSWNGPGSPGPGGDRQAMVRNPISLDRGVRAAAYAPSSEGSRRMQSGTFTGREVAQPLNGGRHGRTSTFDGGNRRHDQPRPSSTAPRGGGFDRGGSPSLGSGSRSGGGGSAPGGGRSGGGGRPR